MTASEGETGRAIADLESSGVERTFVFGEERPFAQCHASTLVETGDGATLVAFFAGSFEGAGDVAIWTARRPGTRIADAAIAADRPAPDPTRRPRFEAPRLAQKIADVAHWNPVLYRLDDRATANEQTKATTTSSATATPSADPTDAPTIALQFKVGASIRRWESYVACSRDDGRSFEPARALVPGDRGGRGAVRNKPIRLASGDWLAGASIERWRRWEAFFDRSPNGLDGWQATAKIAIDRARFAGKGLIQPSLWESTPGRVHALFRTTDGRIHRSDSRDDGHTWSTARPIDVPNNNSALDVARLADGTLALACNPVPGNWAPRTPLSLLFSRDEGASWPWRFEVETGPGEFSYPAVIASGEGLSLCYTWNRRRIAFVRVPSIRELLATPPT